MKPHVLVLLAVVALVPVKMDAQVGAPVSGAAVTFVEPPDDVYIDLIVGAAGWAKGSISRSLGVLQPEDAGPALRRAIDTATKRHALRPISMPDYTIVCVSRQASRSTPASRTCSMKNAEAVLQFSSVKIAGDSGFVGTGVTRVPKNSVRPETVYYCITLSRDTRGWEVRRSESMIDADRCPAGPGELPDRP